MPKLRLALFTEDSLHITLSPMIALDNETHELFLNQEAGLTVENWVPPELVKPIGSLGRISLSEWPATAWPLPDYKLNIAGVCQDAATREWATEVASHAIQLVGERSVQSSWWMIGELSDPRLLVDAVQAAITADILILAVRAADKLPFDLYEWIEAWLPHRLHLAGSLVALIGTSRQSGADSSHIRRYLEEVAWQGCLEFLPQEQELPWGLLTFSTAEIAEPTSAKTQVFSGRINIDHWGINE